MDLHDRQSVVTIDSSQRGSSTWSRRRWLCVTALVLTGLTMTVWAQAPPKAKKAEQEVVVQVQLRAKKVGLGAFGERRSAHFLALGDAPSRFQQEALDKICEALGKDFLAYFRRRGFAVAYPEDRMTVVTLKNADSFNAYIQDNPDEVVAGQYELDSNQLMMFDLRDSQASLNAQAVRVNTFALVHETIHLICFNTGLLSRTADVPRTISEGLATYGELWTPPANGKAGNAKAFGGINRVRLEVLRNGGWIPLSDLLTKDNLFDQPTTGQLAYAESWLLVHYLLQGEQIRKFQTYLAAVPKPGDSKDRIAYAESRLGAIDALDQAVRRHGKRLLRK